jgi:hypothetical protein
MNQTQDLRLNHYMAYLKVAVDENEEGRIAGCVYSQRLKQPIVFMDTKDLLLRIESLLDEQDFPRAFQRKRTFDSKGAILAHDGTEAVRDDNGDYMDEESVQHAEGKQLTFSLNILTRQNTSWQGYLDWLDGSERISFDSDLELLSMINEGLRNKG